MATVRTATEPRVMAPTVTTQKVKALTATDREGTDEQAPPPLLGAKHILAGPDLAALDAPSLHAQTLDVPSLRPAPARLPLARGDPDVAHLRLRRARRR